MKRLCRSPHSRHGFTLLFVFILCIGLAGLLTALTFQTLVTLDATDAADESLRHTLSSQPNAGAAP